MQDNLTFGLEDWGKIRFHVTPWRDVYLWTWQFQLSAMDFKHTLL
jgi:hypothetical protein